MPRILVVLICLTMVLAAAAGSFFYLKSQGALSGPTAVTASPQPAKVEAPVAQDRPKRNRPAPVVPATKVDSLDDSQVVWDSEERRAQWEARKSRQ